MWFVQPENLVGFVTLEQFMLKKQAEERRQVYTNRVLMGVEHQTRAAQHDLLLRLHNIGAWPPQAPPRSPPGPPRSPTRHLASLWTLCFCCSARRDLRRGELGLHASVGAWPRRVCSASLRYLHVSKMWLIKIFSTVFCIFVRYEKIVYRDEMRSAGGAAERWRDSLRRNDKVPT